MRLSPDGRLSSSVCGASGEQIGEVRRSREGVPDYCRAVKSPSSCWCMRTPPSRWDTSPISCAALRGQGRTFCSLPAAEVPCGYAAGMVYADPSVPMGHLPYQLRFASRTGEDILLLARG